MTTLNANPAFLPVLRQVCSNADSFPVLLRRPLWRALAHYFLLGLLCVALNVVFRALPVRQRLSFAIAAFDARYGQVVAGMARLFPAIEPETARGLSMGAIRVDYFPDIASARGFSPAAVAEPVGLLWTPSALLLWQKFDERRCSVMPFPAAVMFSGIEVKPALPALVDMGEVAGHLDQCVMSPTPSRAKAAPENADGPYALSDFLPFGWGVLMLAVLCESALKAFLVAPSYVLMFCLVMHFFRPRGVPGPSLAGMLKLGFYAAFPGLIIGMLCSALELPFLEFHLVFSLAFLLWLFIVYGHMRRLTERPAVDEEDFA